MIGFSIRTRICVYVCVQACECDRIFECKIVCVGLDMYQASSCSQLCVARATSQAMMAA